MPKPFHDQHPKPRTETLRKIAATFILGAALAIRPAVAEETVRDFHIPPQSLRKR